MLFGGTAEPTCFAVLKNIGVFTRAQTERLSALLCAQLSEGLGVAPSRIYIEFIDAEPHRWGHDSGVF
jgi:phenylpyruvate tautomerase